MSWLNVGNLLAAARGPLLVAAKGPLQAAALTYVGAAGLAGAALVGGVMVSPAREVVQQAMEPVGELVQTIVPMSLVPVFVPEPQVLPTATPQPSATVPTRAVPAVAISQPSQPQVDVAPRATSVVSAPTAADRKST